MRYSRFFEKCKNLIDQHGFLLVYSQTNRETPQSLWSLLYPGSPMSWEWSETSDDRVMRLWLMREELARSREVIYGKFYQNRATFFSKKVFTNLLATKGPWDYRPPNPHSREVLEVLEMDSPLSTKQLKEATGLRGKMLEASFHRAIRDLWENFLIIGMGEIDDGAFPSLAYAATQTVFEELWQEAQTRDPVDAMISLMDLKDFDSLERSLLRIKFWRKASLINPVD